jgi:hypothetical protein
MQNSELFDLLVADANHPFAGWDFSHISATGRMAEAPLSWSYASKLLIPLRRAQSLLDMGTGGGEFLSSLQPLPPLTCTTEGYTPNISLARQRLEPLGIKVYEVGEDLNALMRAEEHPIMRFFDVGAIVYYLKAIPWQIPDFSVEGYFDKLVEIHNLIEQRGYIDFHMDRFLIIAEKQAV